MCLCYRVFAGENHAIYGDVNTMNSKKNSLNTARAAYMCTFEYIFKNSFCLLLLYVYVSVCHVSDGGLFCFISFRFLIRTWN